jgi:hypothetical protein
VPVQAVVPFIIITIIIIIIIIIIMEMVLQVADLKFFHNLMCKNFTIF